MCTAVCLCLRLRNCTEHLRVLLQMMRLGELLEGSQDLAEQVLSLLTPKALGLLACTSTCLRAVVTRLPEAVWQASTESSLAGWLAAVVLIQVSRLQAVAQRALPVHHPALQAQSVQAYFKLRGRVEASILQGGWQVRQLHAAAGCISPDCAQMALRLGGPELQIRNLRTHKSTLWTPHFPATAQCAKRDWGANDEGDWAWDASSRDIVVTCSGRCGAHDSLLLFLDTHTRVQAIALTPGAEFNMESPAYCVSRGLVLVQHKDAQQGPPGQVSVLSVWDFKGTLLHRMRTPAGFEPSEDVWAYSVQHAWAPAGFAFNLSVFRAKEACLLQLPQGSGAPELVQASPASHVVYSATAPACLLLNLCSSSPATLISFEGQSAVSTSCSAPDLWHYASIVWGTRLVVQSGQWGSSFMHANLDLYSVQGSRLRRECRVGCSAERLFLGLELHLCSDGALCATFTARPLDDDLETVTDIHLAIVHLASGALREVALGGAVAEDCGDWNLRVHWVADCTAVLVSDRCGRHSQLVSFV